MAEEHRKNVRRSSREKHQQGRARKSKAAGAAENGRAAPPEINEDELLAT
jgi:hypothetical protein